MKKICNLPSKALMLFITKNEYCLACAIAMLVLYGAISYQL